MNAWRFYAKLWNVSIGKWVGMTEDENQSGIKCVLRQTCVWGSRLFMQNTLVSIWIHSAWMSFNSAESENVFLSMTINQIIECLSFLSLFELLFNYLHFHQPMETQITNHFESMLLINMNYVRRFLYLEILFEGDKTMIDNGIIGESEEHISKLELFECCVFGVCKRVSNGYFELWTSKMFLSLPFDPLCTVKIG